MIDIKNLNRVKGILSAKQGAEIPKYNPGGTFNINDPDYQKWCAQFNFRLGPNTWQQYQHAKNSVPNGSLEEVIKFTNDNGANLPIENANKAIPGDPKITPTTAVETAADTQEKVRLTQQEYEVSKQQETLQGSQEDKTPAVSALNKPPTSDTNLLQQDMNKGTAEPSAGVKMFEQQTQDKREKIANAIGQGASVAINAVGQAAASKQQATDSNLTKTADTVYGGVAEAAKSMGPVGELVGTAMQNAKIAGDIIQELGGGTDQQTKIDKWMDSAFFSWNIGMLNGFAGKKTQDFGVDQNILTQVGSSYGGTVDSALDAAEKAGKKYGLFSTKARKKANAVINKARSQQNIMGTIADNASDQRLAVQSMGEQAGLAYSMMTNGGYDQKYTYAAKHGGLLEWSPVIELNWEPTLEWEPQIELNWELPTFKEGGNIDIVEELEWIPEFKNGGKTEDSDIPETEETTQKNVIPEGALHKNKHHMEHAEGLTKKGIPVIDDDGDQQAEIEHSEIIFTLEVTKKLEEYYEIFYSDESSNKEKEQAALDVGKLLVYQILENTEDRTGLIDSCKNGGTLTVKKSEKNLIDDSATMGVENSTEKDSEKNQIKELIKEALVELILK